MVQLSATRCSCIIILWVSLVSFAAITLCVASQRVFIVVSVYFIIDSVRKLLDTPSYTSRVLVGQYLAYDCFLFISFKFMLRNHTLFRFVAKWTSAGNTTSLNNRQQFISANLRLRNCWELKRYGRKFSFPRLTLMQPTRHVPLTRCCCDFP
jgi:hypothetical protein